MKRLLKAGACRKYRLWTEAEKQRYYEAFQLHPRAWKTIAAHVKTRTVDQVREFSKRKPTPPSPPPLFFPEPEPEPFVFPPPLPDLARFLRLHGQLSDYQYSL